MKMKKLTPFFIIGLVALVTLTSGTLLYRAKRVPTISLKGRSLEPKDTAHVLGASNALVTLEEFGDFQCPPCGMLSEPLNQLSRDFPKLRIVFKHFPLPMHLHAREAARAAEAAGRQGQFWKMHDLLYRDQAIWSKAADVRAAFVEYARQLGCEIELFKEDIDSESVEASIKADQEEGTKLGVRNTPTIFLNNSMVPAESLDPKDLRAAVEAISAHPAASPPGQAKSNAAP